MLLENLEERDASYRVGSLLELYRLLLEGKIQNVADLLMTLIGFIEQSKFQTCEYTVFVALEILHFIGYADVLVDRIHLISQYLENGYSDLVRSKALKLIFSLDYPGISAIVITLQNVSETVKNQN